MAKRYGQEFYNYNASPAKKPRVDSPRQGALPKEKRQSIGRAVRSTDDDVWGDDFDDDAIEEMDLIVSQACSQDVNASMDSRIFSNQQRASRSTSVLHPVPSTSRTVNNYPANRQISRLKERNRPFSSNETTNAASNGQVYSQKLASSENIRDMLDDEGPMLFNDFRNNLLERGHLNSTFNPRNDVVVVSDDTRLRQLVKLEQENKKLLDDFMIKEGETVFLRNQLQQTQLRAENERMEKARLIEEQASRYRAEINALHKEKDNMKTQYDFQTLQLGNLMERCKLLESGAIKLTHPQKVDSPNRSRFGVHNRSVPAIKAVKVNEISVQTSSIHRSSWDLKTSIRDRPLDTIPQTIFEKSLPEKFVVDIQIIEKFGKKNLPILQEEDTFRIFENPDLVKPIVTVVDDRKLNVEYFQPDIAVIMKKTRTEINSKDCIPIVNKIVSTTRELLLNATLVLQTISTAMKNDDIRDMNDLYFSDFYDAKIDYSQSICDSNVWYEKERGIEARRAMGTLSYIAKVSNYLGEYIAGKTQLIVENDLNYSNYDKQMIRYSAWSKKGQNFEILEMILEFVTAVGLVRRSHQFSGLICAIVSTLCSVQERVGFCPRGLKYISNIFKEIVFSRPLVRCFISMTKLIAVFCKSSTFGQKICSCNPNVTSLNIWKGAFHFTPDACSLEIYMAQIETFRLDPITTVNISDEFLSFVHLVFLSNSIAWTTESSNSCTCCMRILTFTMTLLCKCSKINLRTIEKENSRSSVSAKLDDTFWRKVRRKQMNALRKGVRFLSYLAKRDPDFIIRVSDIEDSFHLFMHHVTVFEGLTLHENEQEALALIKSTLMFDKPSPMEPRSQKSQKIFNIKSAFEEKPYPSPSSGRWYEINNGKKDSSQQAIKSYEGLLNG